MVQISKIIYTIVLLGKLLFITTTHGYYETIDIRIKNDNELIELKLKRTEQLLVNKNLAVWYAMKNNQPYLLPNIMDELGDVITYHDIEKSSAVVYMSKYNVFYGVIDTRFCIVQLPIEQIGSNIYHEVGGSYVIARSDNDYLKYFHNGYEDLFFSLLPTNKLDTLEYMIDTTSIPIISTQSSQSSNKPDYDITTTSTPLSSTTIKTVESIDKSPIYRAPSLSFDSVLYTDEEMKSLELELGYTDVPISPTDILSQPGHSKDISVGGGCTEKPPNIFYPEILVFISNDIMVQFLKLGSTHGLLFLIFYYIVYFNAIDMLFAKLSTNENVMHLNLAGLVIEYENGAFPYSISQGNQANDIHDSIHADKTLFNIVKYINKHKNIFVDDSFDFFFLSTSYNLKKRGRSVSAYSRPSVDIFSQRKYNALYTYLLGSVVQRDTYFGDYVTATRVIAELLNIESGTPSTGLKNYKEECYGIMQKCKNYCSQCLTWSEKNRWEMAVYWNSNRNRCFLLNYPRSLRPYGHPMVSITWEQQCSCYGFSESALASVPDEKKHELTCDKSIQCTKFVLSRVFTPFVFDGTPCATDKVCWRKKCRDIGKMVDINEPVDELTAEPKKRKRPRKICGKE